MRVLVTGGAGFIGSNLAKALAARKDQVVVADDFSSAYWKNLAQIPGGSAIDVVTVDVAEHEGILEDMGPFDAIYHQASITDTTVTDQRRMNHNNIEGFRAILDLAVAWKSRVVWASSASIYGQGPSPMKVAQEPDPLNVYAFSKLAMERLAASYVSKLGRPIVGLRYFNVYGAFEDHKGKFASMIHQLARQMRQGKKPRIFSAGQQKRDFVYIQDVIDANILAAGLSVSGVFNVGSGQAESFNRVIEELNRALKTKLNPEYFENPYGFTQDWTEADLDESRRVLGYEPKFNLAKGIDAYLATGQLGIASAANKG